MRERFGTSRWRSTKDGRAGDAAGEALALLLEERTFHHAFVVWDGRRITHVSSVALTAIVGRFH